MKILLATDSFPPDCGGSGWSTYELARGLRTRGHDVSVVHARPGTPAGARTNGYDGFRIREFGAAAPAVPYLRNYCKNERFYPRLSEFLTERLARERIDVIHAQHVLTCLPAIEAGRITRVPSVCTVRDYWPVCYWSDLIHTRDGQSLCPACSAGMMTQCIRPRAGAAWPLALPMIPYMRANLARKKSGLARASAVIAVSSTIAADLRSRAPEVASARIEIIGNPVNISDLRRRAARPRQLAKPYALYLGKLAPNKGTSHLVRIAERADLEWPLVIAGDGPERSSIAAAAAQSRRDIRLTGWVDQDAAASWLAHASVLVFPSRGPESLSRVLIEASALGVPIAAMDTGGTRDIIVDEETGLLSTTPEELADDVRRLKTDEDLRRRLGAAAAKRVEARFDSSAIVSRIETLYRELIAESNG
jgi:glycogen synthase